MLTVEIHPHNKSDEDHMCVLKSTGVYVLALKCNECGNEHAPETC